MEGTSLGFQVGTNQRNKTKSIQQKMEEFPNTLPQLSIETRILGNKYRIIANKIQLVREMIFTSQRV